MSQQMVNGSYRKGDTTFTYRMSDRYAVVSDPLKGKHKKPQDIRSKLHGKRIGGSARKMQNNYHVSIVWNGDTYERDVIAFDFGITNPSCLTIFHISGGCLIIGEAGIEKIEITPLRS